MCLIVISMEIGMLNFWLGLLVTALTKENYFNDKRELSFKNGLNFLVFQFFYQKFFYFFSVFLEGGRFCNILWSANDKRGLSFENGPIMTGRTMKTVIWWSFPNQLLLFYGRRSTMGWIFLWRRIILFFHLFRFVFMRFFGSIFHTSPVHVVLVSLLVNQLSGLFLIFFGQPKKICPVSGNFWSVSDFFW